MPTNGLIGIKSAVEEVLVEVLKVRFPGRSRTIRSQFDFEDRGTLRLQGDQDGDTDGKDFITEIKHHFFLGHPEGGRDTAAIVFEVLTERAHRAWLVVEVFED